MGENSKIEWTHHTFNPWIGCVKVSPGCQHCYAEAQNKRWGKDLWGVDKPRQITSAAYWHQPLEWNDKAEVDGERRRVFCASMADVFEDREDLIEPRARLWNLIAATPALDWLLLTKRPENLLRMVPWMASDGMPWPNVWLGTSCEDQRRADERIPHLLSVPAVVRFLSCEPLLGPVTLRDEWRMPRFADDDPRSLRADGRGVDWVIAGGESGHGARPMHPGWARSLRDQCEEFGVSFFFKQWGEWFPRDQWEHNPALVLPDDGDAYSNDTRTHVFIDAGEYYPMHRVGKQKAGRLLNGREWSQIPAPRRLGRAELPAKQESLF